MDCSWLRCIKAISFILQIVVLIMLLTSVSTTYWIERDMPLGKYHEGLWQSCIEKVCLNLRGSPLKTETINTVRVAMLFGIAFSFVACVISTKLDLRFAAIASFASCVLVMTGMGVYTKSTSIYIYGPLGFNYDWSFILGWIAAVSALIVTVTSAVSSAVIARGSRGELLP